jgi:uncharacterized protein
MIKTENFILNGANNRKMLCDVTSNEYKSIGKLIIFFHGFKSFTNWGCWPWLSEQFAAKGYVFLKINFSHNGVGNTAETCKDFIDLEAFGENSFSKQLEDIDSLMHYINISEIRAIKNSDKHNIICMGHSMGGGMAILAAAKYKIISHLITLNSMSNFFDLLKRYNAIAWEKAGKVFVENTRTNQQMPLHYQLYENYMQNKMALDIPSKATEVHCKWLLVYATKDETILPQNAFAMQQLNTNIQLCAIENTGHTFGATHPFDLKIKNSLEEVVEKILEFLGN